MSKYHLKHRGPQIDNLLDKAGTALQEHQDISHLVSYADLQTGLADKVDKIDGKGLSTEDFTTVLRQKLEGLQNYDDTAINEAISKLEGILNTIVCGDTSDAIESFNEIIAFLSSIKDTESLSSIITSIEQLITDKQDKINDLDSIREGAAKGATAIQEHQQLKTINGESIIGSGDITIQGGSGNPDANVQAVDTDDDVLDDVETITYIKYVAQSLTDAQKAQARKNIGVDEVLPDMDVYATKEYVDNVIQSSILNVLNTPV